MDVRYPYKIFSKLFMYKLIDEQISHLSDAQFVNQILFLSFMSSSFLEYSIIFDL